MFSTTSCRRRAGSGCIARLATHSSASTRSRSLTSPSFCPPLRGSRSCGDVEKAVRHARRAAERAVQLLAYEEAARLFRLALEALIFSRPRSSDRMRALDRTRRRAGACRRFRRGEANVPASRGECKAPEMPELLARAALGYGGRFVWEPGRGDPHLLPLLEDALAALPKTDSEPPGQVAPRSAGGPLATCRPPRVGGPRSPSKQSRRHEDSETHRLSRMPSTAAAWRSGAHTRRSRSAMRSRQSSSRWPRPRETRSLMYDGHMFRFAVAVEVGDMRAVTPSLEAQTRLAEDLRQPAQLWFEAVLHTTLATFEGRFAEAEEPLARGEARRARCGPDCRRLPDHPAKWRSGGNRVA